jgi:hypothetical protein
MMCRYYYKKLTPEKRTELVKEVEAKERCEMGGI